MKVEIRPDRSAYQPGEEIKGTLEWTLDSAPRTAELRLFWQTRGKGSRDTETVQNLVFDRPQAGDTRTFSFVAPKGPPSFSGNLISLVWGLELVLEPGGAESIDLTIAPEGKELDLNHPEWLAVPEPKAWKLPWKK